jgi:Rrf2 family nitric oxide-sensitive transcriptional repressor
MRLTTRTNLAMRTLMFCALNADRTVRTAEVAERCNASENHLGQVINTLGHQGLIRTVRGRGGGIRLARDPADINVGEVTRIFEADSAFAECFQPDGGSCPIVSVCRLRGVLSSALEAFYDTLDRVSLDDLVRDNMGLARMFVLR